MNISHDFCIFFRLIIVFIFDSDFIFNKTFSTATFCIYNYIGIHVPYLCIIRDTSVESYDIHNWPRFAEWPRHVFVWSVNTIWRIFCMIRYDHPTKSSTLDDSSNSLFMLFPLQFFFNFYRVTIYKYTLKKYNVIICFYSSAYKL